MMKPWEDWKAACLPSVKLTQILVSRYVLQPSAFPNNNNDNNKIYYLKEPIWTLKVSYKVMKQ